MRHAEHGHALFGQFDHCIQNLFDHLGVKRRCRFIEQHDARTHTQRTGDCHTLLLTAGQLARILVGLIGDLHLFKEVHRRFFGFFLGCLTNPDRSQRAVFQNGQVREQVEVLEAHANLGPDLVDVFQIRRQDRAVHGDPPALVFFQRVDAADQGGFTGTRRARDNDPFATIDGQVDIPQHVERAVPFVHFLD